MDDATMMALLWAGGSVTFVAALWSAVSKSIEYRRNLRKAAETFGGQVLSEEWGDRPRLEFSVNGVRGEFQYSPGPWSRVRFEWAPPGHLRLGPPGIGASLRRMLTAAEVPANPTEFDRRFEVLGAPATWVGDLLDEEMRTRILALTELRDPGDPPAPVRLEIGPPGLTLFYKGNLAAHPERLIGFLDHAVAVLTRVRGLATAGMKLMTAVEAAAAGQCPVCGAAMDGFLRRCGRCRTLHHEDCWHYFGGCAMYACSCRHGQRVRPSDPGGTA